MNNDLISRSALLKSFDVAKMVEYDETGCGVTRIAIPVQTIKDAPTIDAVEVVHAYWMDGIFCSRCRAAKARPWAEYLEQGANTFCHVCGAKMDGGADK